MKIEYGRAWDWFLKLIFKEKLIHHDKWLADIIPPAIEETIEQKQERLWAGEVKRWDEDKIRYVNHQIPSQPGARDYIDEEIKKELGIPITIHKRHRPPILGIDIPHAHAKLPGDPLFREDEKENNDKDS